MLGNIFIFCLVIGFAIPLINLLTGWFGSVFGGVSVEVDVDLDASAPGAASGGGLIPFNIMCFCLFLAVFGASGQATRQFMVGPLFTVLFLALCLVLAALAYLLLYKLLVKRLKESDVSALSYRDLKGRTAEVTLGISGDSMGTISLQDNTGAAISFRAKLDPDLKRHMPNTLQKGECVVITEVDAENKLCYVAVFLDKIIKTKMGES